VEDRARIAQRRQRVSTWTFVFLTIVLTVIVAWYPVTQIIDYHRYITVPLNQRVWSDLGQAAVDSANANDMMNVVFGVVISIFVSIVIAALFAACIMFLALYVWAVFFPDKEGTYVRA
jgi:ABC-type sugar transport system permease subunit